jgi:hypothetical protein
MHATAAAATGADSAAAVLRPASPAALACIAQPGVVYLLRLGWPVAAAARLHLQEE